MNSTYDIAIGVPAGSQTYARTLRVIGSIFLLSTAWLVYMLATSPASVPWPFFAVNYLFLLGLTQFGICLQAIIRLAGGAWSRPFHRLGEVSTLAYGPIAIIGFLVIFFFGRHELYFWIGDSGIGHRSPFLNESFLLWRNLIAQLVFYSLAKLFFFLSLRPDIRAGDAENGTWLRRLTYRAVLTLFKDGDPAVAQRRLYYLSPVLLIACGIAQTFIAWDLGMMLVEHYHSTVYPLYFMVGNMLAGTALLLLLLIWMSRMIPTEAHFGVHQLKSAGVLLTAFTLLWLYMFWAQFFVSWFGNLHHEYGVLGLQMFGHYGVYFWTMMLCVFGIPIGTLIFAPVKRMRWSLGLLALIIVAGMWLNRYLMVVPGLIEGDRPFSSLSEFLVAVVLFSGFLTILLWSFRLVPMLSGWQLRGVDET